MRFFFHELSTTNMILILTSVDKQMLINSHTRHISLASKRGFFHRLKKTYTTIYTRDVSTATAFFLR